MGIFRRTDGSMSKFSKAALLFILPAIAMSSFMRNAEADPKDAPAQTAVVEKAPDAQGFRPLELKKVKMEDFDALGAQYPAFKFYLDDGKQDMSGPVEASFGTVKYHPDKPEVAFLRMTGGGQCGTQGCTLLAVTRHEDKDVLVLNATVQDPVMLRAEGGTLKAYFCVPGPTGSKEWELRSVMDPITKVLKPSFEPNNSAVQPKSPACARPAP